MQVLVKQVLEIKHGDVLFLGVIEGGTRDGEQVTFNIPLMKGGRKMMVALTGVNKAGIRNAVYAELPDE